MKRKTILQRQACQPAGQFDAQVPALLQRIYLNRGITRQEELQKDLSGLPAPELFKGMDEAVALLIDALKNQQKIFLNSLWGLENYRWRINQGGP